ncbi:hypothetical protein [Lacrimispora indolis]|uniref:hypothetical protein n=1 Tax=Lacrimispora indolis TaxID=69825 RepID=UPI00045EBA54|nr:MULTISPECIES: hypothetical protein [Lachnospiraceae]
MYEEIINIMKEKNVIFSSGINETDLSKIHQIYEIMLPKELIEFYSLALPISKGFYNWKDFSLSNIEHIKSALKRPENDLIELVDEVYWCDDWGEEPLDENEKAEVINNFLKTAPKLIPIFTHRYLPSYPDNKSNPVFSIHGTDVIYYGNDLLSYLQIEFGLKDYNDIDYSKIPHVPFWSDLI